MSRKNSLLINEPPLQALPSLACLVGLTAAVILQQIHYWLQASEHIIEGEIWVYNSYAGWGKQFKWITARAVQKHILELERAGYLISGHFKYKGKGNTKFYRIDYDKLDADCEKSNNDCEKSNNDCEKSNNDSALISQSTKLNSAIEYHKSNHKTIHNNSNALIISSIFDAINMEFGYPDKTNIDPVPNHGKEAAAISRMLKRGFAADQIIATWRAKVRKRGEYVSMVWVNEDIGKAPAGQSRMSLPGEDEIVASAQAKGLVNG